MEKQALPWLLLPVMLVWTYYPEPSFKSKAGRVFFTDSGRPQPQHRPISAAFDLAPSRKEGLFSATLSLRIFARREDLPRAMAEGWRWACGDAKPVANRRSGAGRLPLRSADFQSALGAEPSASA